MPLFRIASEPLQLVRVSIRHCCESEEGHLIWCAFSSATANRVMAQLDLAHGGTPSSASLAAASPAHWMKPKGTLSSCALYQTANQSPEQR
jgi:hypothetical protein